MMRFFLTSFLVHAGLELGEPVVWLSVNTPVKFDLADGLSMRTAQEFVQCLEALQSKRASTSRPVLDGTSLLLGYLSFILILIASCFLAV